MQNKRLRTGQATKTNELLRDALHKPGEARAAGMTSPWRAGLGRAGSYGAASAGQFSAECVRVLPARWPKRLQHVSQRTGCLTSSGVCSGSSDPPVFRILPTLRLVSRSCPGPGRAPRSAAHPVTGSRRPQAGRQVHQSCVQGAHQEAHLPSEALWRTARTPPLPARASLLSALATALAVGRSSGSCSMHSCARLCAAAAGSVLTAPGASVPGQRQDPARCPVALLP